MADSKARVGVFGGSGYAGNEIVRLLLRHPKVELKILTGNRNAGKPMATVYPQFAGLELPNLVKIEEVDPTTLDYVFTALPHGTTQTVIKKLFADAPKIKVGDISADFRLSDPVVYEKWYGHAHQATDLQKEAVYGLTEIYREQVKKARLVANPGCFTTTSILAVAPLLEAGAIETDQIVIDSKTGMTGAGRAVREEMLFSEVSEGLHAYGVGHHRHMSELDQEFSLAAKRPVIASFTPHLAPMNRGIYASHYLTLVSKTTPEQLHKVLVDFYKNETFVNVLDFGAIPQSRHVRGTNNVQIGVVADRVPGKAIVISTLDNLVKGASGQAVQNMNLMLGYAENESLMQLAMFP